jgi:hypothetical protein
VLGELRRGFKINFYPDPIFSLPPALVANAKILDSMLGVPLKREQ